MNAFNGLKPRRAAWLAWSLLCTVLALAVASDASAQEDGCFAPADAATAFEDLLPVDVEDENLCRKACKAWELGCLDVVGASAACLLALLDTEVEIEIATECKALAGSARRECLAEARADRIANRDSVEAQLAAARASCRITADQCRADGCSGEE